MSYSLHCAIIETNGMQLCSYTLLKTRNNIKSQNGPFQGSTKFCYLANVAIELLLVLAYYSIYYNHFMDFFWILKYSLTIIQNACTIPQVMFDNFTGINFLLSRVEKKTVWLVSSRVFNLV